MIKILSLFANIGVAEAYLKEMGIKVLIANELEERRAKLYSDIYPETEMVSGDITNEKIFNHIIKSAKKKKVNCIMATPPCQGMSTAGQQADDDERNRLIIPVIEAVHILKPDYVFIENVPNFLNTSIQVNNRNILIPEFINNELNNEYEIHSYTINTKRYSVPQVRERAIFLITKKKLHNIWLLPKPDERIITMKDAIGNIPSIDPYIKDISKEEMDEMFPKYEEKKKRALEISKWNIPPHHIKRQVVSMMHTPTGKTAFDNDKYFPVKENGIPVKGYRNTYKRQNWDTPAYTVTMDNRKISSQNNVHPGRYVGKDKNGDDLYSDARTLTLYELMLVMSLPSNWPVPDNTSEAFLRRVIGEGIPPLFVKKVFEELIER
jgi:DNA (cytosine-5)-methyltransferase 1